MKQKKKILFAIESLTLAGSEKSLIALLSNLDSKKYDIDLQLFHYGKELEKFIPNHVNLLPALDYTLFAAQSWKDTFKEGLLNRKLSYLRAKLFYSLGLRMKKRNHSEIAKLYWNSVGNAFKTSKREYDVAIGFAQGFPTFYVADKIKARKKFCWINANMVLKGQHREFINNYYQKFDKVVCITSQTKQIIQSQLSSLKNLMILENIVDYRKIMKASNLKDVKFEKNKTNILTVGRLNKNSKGMDIALDAIMELKKKRNDFHWYFLGDGSFRTEMASFILNNGLQNIATLLKTDENPYFKAAD